MKFLTLFLSIFYACTTLAIDEGKNIYLHGKDKDGRMIDAYMNGIKSAAPLSCVNCHRESGLGTSESGQTIPPVSWGFLSEDQPRTNVSRFYNIHNKRKVYDKESFYRVLTRGINSDGQPTDSLMPRYALTEHQSEELIAYLSTLYVEDDPGVDSEVIKIATVIDPRLSHQQVKQHLLFLERLFKMKNAKTRGEIKRKKFSPIQKVPQYESFRIWELEVWELPSDPEQWQTRLEQYYQKTPVFVVLSPQVKNNYQYLAEFCESQRLPCLFGNGTGEVPGGYYNYVFRDVGKQQRDFVADKHRKHRDQLYYLNHSGVVDKLADFRVDLPSLTAELVLKFQQFYEKNCSKDHIVLLKTNVDHAWKLSELHCGAEEKTRMLLLPDVSADFQGIKTVLEKLPEHSKICWATDYSRVLTKNTRQIRVDVLTRRIGIDNPLYEILANDLFAFGLLTDSIHQLAGNFSRAYLLEIMEHMLNSFPNYTYYDTVSGAPYQRSVVGPYAEFCPLPEEGA